MYDVNSTRMFYNFAFGVQFIICMQNEELFSCIRCRFKRFINRLLFSRTIRVLIITCIRYSLGVLTEQIYDLKSLPYLRRLMRISPVALDGYFLIILDIHPNEKRRI